ncbi:hypothetical protein AA874_003278 [Salmonella enterica subsp. salamae]|uniref:Uncharacterized protein n=1 Tax=Salmonella enterica subsp. houtenae serovar 44:z36[z38]:- TaxID=1967609 RepID=A0A736I1C9_SALHO|nr:hypothetical protein [Salmonella enterica subsp. salamae]HAE7581330.1 hypothetical protein [Salmonella enterica subsp. houtenae serovar 44:z36[z38]:-]
MLQGLYQVRIHVVHPVLLCSLPFLVRSCLPWHYPNSPKCSVLDAPLSIE